MTERAVHWESVWDQKDAKEVSWFQTDPGLSIRLVQATGLGPDARIVDVGGGVGALVPALVERGYRSLAVVDIAAPAIERAKAALGARAGGIAWHVGDVTAGVPGGPYDVWHDRAVFHFLTTPEDQQAYVRALTDALAPDGHAVIATFAPDGPEKCSGLPVARHDAASIARVLGPSFALQDEAHETHVTPWGAEQRFAYARFKRIP